VSAPVPPREARWHSFTAAARLNAPRDTVLKSAADELETDPASLEAALFADLASESRAGPLPPDISPEALAFELNFRLVSRWLVRAESVRVRAWGNTRALLRQARQNGLICNARAIVPRSSDWPSAGIATSQGVELDVSGPLSLFRRTSIYGRALCALLSRLLTCSRFWLSASCALGAGMGPMTLVVQSGDPIRPLQHPRELDAKVEQRFARDFRRAAPDWELAREPLPLCADGSLVFADFELWHRSEPKRRFLLEIVGFWTPRYLHDKLRNLRAAGISDFVLCVDEARACDDGDPPAHPQVLRFKRRVDATLVLSLLQAKLATTR
jgi:predicted nuclease of restriction endonuclease-like RecB superfamily